MRALISVAIFGTAAAVLGCAPAVPSHPRQEPALGGKGRVAVRFIDTADGAPIACRWTLLREGTRGELEGTGTSCDALVEEGAWTLRVQPLDPEGEERVVMFDVSENEILSDEIEVVAQEVD